MLCRFKKESVKGGRPLEITDTIATSNLITSSGALARSQADRILTMVATGYDGCYKCNYPFYGRPSHIGLPLARGIVAVDPNIIPMGTRLYIDGYGEAIAADQGEAIKGNRIDLFFDSHQEALDWGIRNVEVAILSSERKDAVIDFILASKTAMQFWRRHHQ